MPKSPTLNLTARNAAQRDKQLAAQKAALIDEYGLLDEKIAPLKPHIRRLEELGKTLRDLAGEAGQPDESVTLSGTKYDVVAGPMKLQTHIESLHLVFKELGRTKFIEAASMTIKSLEANVEPARVAALTRKQRTGARPLVARKKAA